MSKYVCSVCGYIYDEAKGIPEAGIAPGTKWEELPEDWVCPLCGASKSEFEKQGQTDASPEKKPISVIESSTDMKQMSALEISALCTNLARGCEKQYKPEEAALFKELAGYFKTASAPAKEPDYNKLLALIEKDLTEDFPNANAVASNAKDRGALRALVWSEKVTRILKSLLTRYQKEGNAMLENTGVYVCTICGFVYIGNNPPEICPVCKVPNWKFEKIEGRQ
jgi:rubredoxin